MARPLGPGLASARKKPMDDDYLFPSDPGYALIGWHDD
jgi:hypothetical protein